MMSIFITTLVLTLPLYIFTQETCPKELPLSIYSGNTVSASLPIHHVNSLSKE
uniref:U21-Theriditoxin-Lha1c_1 n=1 Tax=Latrodectus hasselti TaxID=256736 RepID=A0A482ZDG4_LATHA